MFDVSWQDPEKETVGQRRQRKERDVGRPSGSQRRGSIKTNSSSSSSQVNSALRPPTKSSSSWGFFTGSKKSSSKGKEKESHDSRSKTPINEFIRETSTKQGDDRKLQNVLSKQEAEYNESIERPPTPGMYSVAV